MTSDDDVFSGVSSISLANISLHCDSANSDHFESTRRPTYTVTSSESEDGGVVMKIVKDKRRIEEEEDDFSIDYDILTKRRRILEANGRGEIEDDDTDDDYEPSFLNPKKPKKAAKKVPKKRGWHCHVCQLSTSGQRVRCVCKKLIHKVCKSYGLCAPE